MKYLVPAAGIVLVLAAYQAIEQISLQPAKTTADKAEQIYRPLPVSGADTAPSSDLNALNSSLDPLRHQVSQMQNQLDKINLEQETAGNAVTPLEQDSNEQEVALQEEQRQYFENIENNLYAQDESEALYSELSQNLDAVDNPIPGMTVDDYHCGTNICRLNVSVTGEEGVESLQGDFRERISGAFKAGAIRQDEYGRMVVYLATDAVAFESQAGHQ